MSIMRSLPRLAGGWWLSLVIASLVARVTATEQARSEGPRIDVLFSREARAETVTGMVYVAISRDNRRSPIDQTSPTGVPLFSRFVDGLAPDAVATFTAEDRGHPLRRLRAPPAGGCWLAA